MLVNIGGWARSKEVLQIAATNGVYPNNTLTHVAGKTYAQCRFPCQLGGDFSKLVLSFDNAYINTFGVQADGGQALTIRELALELDDPATAVEVTFNGSTSKTLSVGDINVQTDDILPADFGLSYFPKNRKFWVRVKVSLPSDGFYLQGVLCNSVTGAKFVTYPPADDGSASATVGTGALGNPNNATSDPYGYGPSYILGEPIGKHLAVAWIGDSLVYSNADASGWPFTGAGFFSRSAINSSNSNTIAQTKIARGGSTASNFVTNLKALYGLRYANTVGISLGTNDLGEAGDGVVATIVDDLQSLWTVADRSGASTIIGGYLWPRTTSTDTWATAENQTYYTNWGVGEKSQQINDEIADAVGTYLTAYFNPQSIRHASAPLKWAAGVTIDETHPNAVGHAAIAAELRTLLGQ